MSDLDRLMTFIDEGSLLHPVSNALSIVDFANALHNLMDVPDVPLNENAMAVKRLIGEPEHLVLVLADGFGMNFVETLDDDAFIRNHLVAEMRTVFPSTTPIVLTSLATGKWPSRHGVIGWFQNLRQISAVSTIISFVRTRDKKSLAELGFHEQEAYPVPSRIGQARREALHIMPEQLVGSAYSNYWTGGVSQVGYDTDFPFRSIEMLIKRIKTAREPTCVYLYIPHVDSAAHKLGTSHIDTLNAAREVDRLLATLVDALPSNASVIMTSDHGHLDAPPEKTYLLDATDEITRLCNGTLTGDQRAVYAHVAESEIDALTEAVQRRFGEDFLVLEAKDVEETGLLGACAVSEESRYRMGNALLLSTGSAVLDYREILGDQAHPMVSHHGGLTPAEMRIPLVVA